MLTQQDLSQFKKILQPINDRLDKINDKLIEHDKKFDKIDAKFKKIDKQLKKIQKDLTTTIKYFDNNCLTHKKHLDRIEQHLGLSQFPII
ncbi:MAG: hypothetical protein WC720_04955 [Candidatus Shapirobacteria bacterium]|jgi:DNA anti-recombination protein RmuC